MQTYCGSADTSRQQDVIDAVSDLGDVCVDIVTMAKNVDPAVVAKDEEVVWCEHCAKGRARGPAPECRQDR